MKTVCLWMGCILALALVTPQGYCGGGDSAETVVKVGVGYGYSWSPTGDKLAFVSYDTVMVYDLSSGGRTAIGLGGVPYWSPIGNFIAYAKSDSLCIYDFHRNIMAAVKFGSGFGFSWSGDNSLVTIVSRPDTIPQESTYPCHLEFWNFDAINSKLSRDSSVILHLKSLTRPILERARGSVLIRTRSSELKRVSLSVQSAYHRGTGSRFIGVESHFPVIYAGGGTLYDDTGIWLYDTSGVAAKRIDPPNNSFFPLLSPDGLYVLVTDVRGHTTVFDTSGTLMADVANKTGGTWGHDSRYFICKTIQQSEWDVTGGDLFVYSLVTGGIAQLTHTPDIPEFGPGVSPDGRWIAFMTREKGISLIRMEGQ
jgi:hypothetical protein